MALKPATAQTVKTDSKKQQCKPEAEREKKKKPPGSESNTSHLPLSPSLLFLDADKEEK